jgi:hypothetical protein
VASRVCRVCRVCVWLWLWVWWWLCCGCGSVYVCGSGRVCCVWFVGVVCLLFVVYRKAPIAQLKVGCIFILTQPIPSRLWLRYYTAFLLIFFRIILCDLILILAVAASN